MKIKNSHNISITSNKKVANMGESSIALKNTSNNNVDLNNSIVCLSNRAKISFGAMKKSI